MRIDIVTIFPGMLRAPFEESMVRIARERGLLDLRIFPLRNFSKDRHRKVDDRPYGGGPGMVLTPQPVYDALESIAAEGEETPRYILLTPQGERYTQEWAWELSREPRLVLLCGHYEGFDERIREGFPFLELSIGDYVLTGGEIPAMVVVDSIVRLLPGVLGDPDSARQDSFEDGLLDFPQYTRPSEFRGRKVPEVLLSGDHRAIAEWRRKQAVTRTEERRRGDRPRAGGVPAERADAKK
jgi:tRNA (guanine37-N1)-methyltransferase